jgi:hypothetical protein
MEEDISKSLKSALEDALTEDEAIENNWTFVLTENVSLTKNNGADMSDNYSEQGSDSGSSIVVIDSPVLPSCDLHPVLGTIYICCYASNNCCYYSTTFFQVTQSINSY